MPDCPAAGRESCLARAAFELLRYDQPVLNL